MQRIMRKPDQSQRTEGGAAPKSFWTMLGLHPGAVAQPAPKGLRTAPGLGRARTGGMPRNLPTALGVQPHPADRGKPLGLTVGFGPPPAGMGLRTLRVAPGLQPALREKAALHGWLAAFRQHPRGVTPGRLRGALGLSIIAGPSPRAPLPPGLLARLALAPPLAQVTRRREPVLAGGLTKPRALQASPAAIFLRLREPWPALDASPPGRWLEAARLRLAALGRG